MQSSTNNFAIGRDAGKRLTSNHERELKAMLPAPWVVVRAAGSHGVDLVACHPNRPPLLIEQKSTIKDDVCYVNGKVNREQFEAHRELARQGHVVVYAVRFGNRKRLPDKGWKFYGINLMSLNPSCGPFYRNRGGTVHEWFE